MRIGSRGIMKHWGECLKLAEPVLKAYKYCGDCNDFEPLYSEERIEKIKTSGKNGRCCWCWSTHVTLIDIEQKSQIEKSLLTTTKTGFNDAMYLIPIFFGIFGGIIAYFSVGECRGRGKLAWTGLAISILWVFIGLLLFGTFRVPGNGI